MNIEKNVLFEETKPAKALAVMALPTIASQMITLLYNLADTWFIGRTGDPCMIGACSLAATVYMAVVALANVFGVGGGSLMVRLMGEKKPEDARRVASYSVAMAAICALVFSLLVLLCLDPLLRLLGASENTLAYGRQYLLTTTVIGGVPPVLAMCMPQLLRNAGYAREAGLGVGLGSLLNVLLDPLFMFVLLPRGREVLGAGIATLLSNVCSLMYIVFVYHRLREKTVLALPRRLERLSGEQLRSLYSVGLPAAFSIFLFDLVTIVVNRLTAAYGDIPLAAMGIVLKLERIPINVSLGVCLGMVPLIAYNYGSGNRERMMKFFSLTRVVILSFACVCALFFWFFPRPLVSAFIADEATVVQGEAFLRGRCLALPFMMIGYHVTNYMNAVDKGKISLLMAVVRHVALLIPLMLLMNALWAMKGLIWSQLAADLLNAVFVLLLYARLEKRERKKE